MKPITHHRLGQGALWTGRGLSLLLFLFWGAFFVEHMGEWFIAPKQGYPPPHVWVAQALHASILAGLLMMLRWDRVGTLLMAASTVAFFSVIGMNRFPWVALLNTLPLPFFLLYWRMSRREP